MLRSLYTELRNVKSHFHFSHIHICRARNWPSRLDSVLVKLVECVPNFSEGRRADVVDALAAAVADTPGVYLLDRTSDRDHNRSVLTFAGPAEPVAQAMEMAVAVALDRIDMNVHEGEHPRIGAVDVIPFVPLGDTTIDEAIELAATFGERIAERFELPVYLYAKAATRAERAVLADIRRPQFEGLKELIGTPDYSPDFGPAALHPTAGATVVGARPFLIAYNINLESRDVELARHDRAPRARAVGRVAARAGAGAVPRGSWLRAGVDEPARLRSHSPMAGVGDGHGAGARGGRRSRVSRS